MVWYFLVWFGWNCEAEYGLVWSGVVWSKLWSWIHNHEWITKVGIELLGQLKIYKMNIWIFSAMRCKDELTDFFPPRSAPPGDTSSNIKSEADANNRNSQQWGKIWWLFGDGDNFWLRLLLWQSVVYCSPNVPSVSNNHESRQSGIAFVMRGQKKCLSKLSTTININGELSFSADGFISWKVYSTENPLSIYDETSDVNL